ncbi:MAG: acetolactate synthase small subunit [Dysgonamonadaceae bacterium]|jgi:acetolactate synthase-1/3 small subunit|nr:acetolactate synthase small subunit [Dysgonamonadaceae bacterium]
MEQKTLYTVTVFSENTVGLLNQITIIFSRRGLNIETLSVSPSALEGIHKFTITVFADRETVVKVVKQIDKRVDIIKSYFNTDEDLVYQEIALYKIATPGLMALGSIEDIVRRYNVRILDMTEDWAVFEKTGHYQETQALFDELKNRTAENGKNCVLQFIRSGRIAVTRSKVERLSDMLAAMEEKNNDNK